MQRRVSVKPRFWLFVIVFMLLSFCASFAVTQGQYAKADARLGRLTIEKLRLNNEINSLNNRLAYVRTDAYIERVARDELNMIMPGEIRYVSRP